MFGHDQERDPPMTLYFILSVLARKLPPSLNSGDTLAHRESYNCLASIPLLCLSIVDPALHDSFLLHNESQDFGNSRIC